MPLCYVNQGVKKYILRIYPQPSCSTLMFPIFPSPIFNNLQVLGHDAMPFAVHGPGRLPDPATFAGAFGYL